jgi:hypothetical protein
MTRRVNFPSTISSMCVHCTGAALRFAARMRRNLHGRLASLYKGLSCYFGSRHCPFSVDSFEHHLELWWKLNSLLMSFVTSAGNMPQLHNICARLGYV